ncbi:MAG: insulinase family protein [Flavobacteriia bacterium]|nr:insulinase family protein [Flavobacteriia bacterium]
MSDNEPIIFKLSNGIRCVYLEQKSMVSHLGISLLAGSRFEKENEMGLAHFLEHCLFKGTHKRNNFQVLSRLDAVGGEINAYTSKEELCLYASFTNVYFKRSCDLLSDILFNSSFPKKEIEKEKEIIYDEINSYLDSPSDKIFDDFEKHLFPNHPLGYNILGEKSSVQKFTSKDLNQYVQRFLNTNTIVLSFVGSISFKKVFLQLEKYFSTLNNHSKQSEWEEFIQYNKFKISSEEAQNQAHGIVGSIAPGYKNEDRMAMTLLINVLGGPALNSRLTLAVREKYGLTYQIEANYSPFSETGYWCVYFGTDPKYLKKTLQIVYKEIKKIFDNGLSEKQLKSAKEQLKGHIALSMDSHSGLMLSLGKSLLLFNQIDSIQEIYNEIDALNVEKIKKVAQLYFKEIDLSELLYV